MITYMFDAAFPPVKPYPGCSAVAGYIGGNTPHVWTLAEWLRFQHLGQLPIWTGYLEKDPIDHASQAVNAAVKLGWQPNANPRRIIALDFETEIDDAWVLQFAHGVYAGGFVTMPYGSLSSILTDPPCWGRWAAQWPIGPPPANVSDIRALQFHGSLPWDGTEIDLSVIDESVMPRLGHGPRR
jgi:hypothetical protein